MSVEVLQVIRTELTPRGRGVDGDPIRRVKQYWDMDGNLLAEIDPWGTPRQAALTEVVKLLGDITFYSGVRDCLGHETLVKLDRLLGTTYAEAK